MSRSISTLNIKDLANLQVGDSSCYPRDRFKFHWVGFQETDWMTKEIEMPFMPDDLINEWSKRLTGRILENKMYVIVYTTFTHYSGKRVLAIYRHDDRVGLIELAET